VGGNDKKSTDERKPQARRKKIIGIQEITVMHSLSSVRRDDRWTSAMTTSMSTNKNPRIGLARRTSDSADPGR